MREIWQDSMLFLVSLPALAHEMILHRDHSLMLGTVWPEDLECEVDFFFNESRTFVPWLCAASSRPVASVDHDHMRKVDVATVEFVVFVFCNVNILIFKKFI